MSFSKYIISLAKFNVVIEWENDTEILKKISFSPIFSFRTSTKLPGKIKKLIKQIKEYFEFKRKDFDIDIIPWEEIPLSKRKVYYDLCTKVRYGEVISYSELGRIAGIEYPRVVANIMRSNTFPLVIPCHRVIYKNGELGGYSSGVFIKKELLKIEGSYPLKKTKLFI